MFSLKSLLQHNHKPRLTAIDFFKYIGPGFLVTIGFIDPGNWATNIAAGATYNYSLLWVITVSTIILILLQHNAAHLGITTGLCLSEAATAFFPKKISLPLLISAVIATISTMLAEILGAAIALQILFHLPIKIGLLLTASFVLIMLYTSSYRRIEKIIIGFVSLIGISFVVELFLAPVSWKTALPALAIPDFPQGSIPLILAVLGAVVMPHNLFLHSEIIQSRQYNLQDTSARENRLKYEFLDTLISMIAGWGINCAILLLAASTFFAHGIAVTQLDQAKSILQPLLGNGAATLFALALLMAGLSASITAGMAGGSIFTGIFKEPYDITDWHTKAGVGITLGGAVAVALCITDTFRGLIISQILLSIQLPLTIIALICLTSSKRVMGIYSNGVREQILLWSIGAFVIVLNIMLLKSMFFT